MAEPIPFRIEVSRVGEAFVVAPEGELDIATVGSLREALQGGVGDAAKLVLDLRGVEFMDTSALQLLVEQRRRGEQDGRALAVVRGPKAVQRVLDIAGLTPHLRLVDTPEEAVADEGSETT